MNQPSKCCTKTNFKKGVHYADDNIAGLNMAQEVLARALPRFLKEKYNSNPFEVARKIRLSRFDWRTFDPQNPCPRRTN